MTSAPKLIVFTGAGLSADSGIPTFRDADGLWEGHSVNQVANFLTWRANFTTVHRFYNARRLNVALAEPNAAHMLLADWQRRFGAILITQNIDDLAERAGCSDVMHVHGTLTEMMCVACGRAWHIGLRSWGEDERCVCGSLKGVKPNVVFFNERAPLYRPMFKTFDSLTERDILVMIGTGGEVVDIGAVADRTSATTILSNLRSTISLSMPGRPCVEDDQFDIVAHGRAAFITPDLDRIVSELMAERQSPNPSLA